ncbi:MULTISPECIES: hypothetical protein [Bartonella]|uniref:hypothetical protein n=1 Tax=Bartonella TaxID=773 RepID=UPI0018DE0D2D|nr:MULTISPECIES: hypothetical protein [Bartonella]MBI0168678.1 hypothetical protein [Bartonella sp. W8167]MBI0175334.1 hypothetical protein [Bartonella apis]
MVRERNAREDFIFLFICDANFAAKRFETGKSLSEIFMFKMKGAKKTTVEEKQEVLKKTALITKPHF